MMTKPDSFWPDRKACPATVDRRGHAVSARLGMVWLLGVLLLAGCTAAPNAAVVSTFATGEFGRARVELEKKLPDKPARGRNIDRSYLLAHLRVAILTLADGYPDGSSGVFDRVYDVLRMQGINRDKTTVSVVLNEDLKIWKGEPFEQALAYSYIAAQYASQDSWDNARAAISGAMFHLRDFGQDSSGRPLDTQGVVDQASDDLADYRVDETDFVLGHLISALANQQLGRQEEASAHYRQAVMLDSSLRGLTAQLAQGQFNTLLMVDFGQGPAKVGTGPDQSVAAFVPVMSSDASPLVARVGQQVVRVPVVCDVNAMARDHRWNNLEDMRVAKSHIGQMLMMGGAAVATFSNHSETQLVGVGMMLAGMFARAGAHADTRYCEAMPQRVYLVPLMVQAGQAVELQVEGRPASRMRLVGLTPPEKPGQVQFRMVRLLESASHLTWSTTATTHYANPYDASQAGPNLPYILGGTCVRPPTPELMAEYHASGFLRDMTYNQLRDLYLAEGIVWEESPLVFPGLHILEGGDSLVAPLPGTTGYQRLFCQPRQAYRAKSQTVREAQLHVQAQLQGP